MTAAGCAPPCAGDEGAPTDPETTAVADDETDAPIFCSTCDAVLAFALTSDGQRYVWAEVVAALAGAASRRRWFDIAQATGLGGAETLPIFRRRDICDAWYAYALRRPLDEVRRTVILRRLEELGYAASARHRQHCAIGCGFASLSNNGRAILARLEAADLDDSSPGRPRINLRIATGCGHRLPIPPTTGAARYGTSPAGYTYCYRCLDGADRIVMASADDAWVYMGKGGEVTTWTGGILGRVVAQRTGTRRYSRSGFRRPVAYRVRDLDGALWHGRNSDAGGTVLHVRRMRVGAAV